MGNGIFSSTELIDSIIVDCNNSARQLVGGSYISWCSTMVSIVQRLSRLKEGIARENESKQKTIEELTEKLRKCGQEMNHVTAEEIFQKDGAK